MDNLETDKKEEQDRTIKKKKRFLEEFERALSIITISCARAGVGRQTYYDWINKDPIFAEMCKKVWRSQFDYVNDMLLGKIADGNLGAILFYLGRTGTKYRDKIELSSDVGVRAQCVPYSDEELFEMLRKARKKEGEKEQNNGNLNAERQLITAPEGHE